MGFGVRHIIFYADFTGEGNYTEYNLDGHTLQKTVYTDGKASTPQKLHFGEENGDTIRMMIDVQANSFIVKNRAGMTIDTIRKNSIGRLAFLNDVTLNMTP